MSSRRSIPALSLVAVASVLAGCTAGEPARAADRVDCSETTTELRTAMADKPVFSAASAHPKLSVLVSLMAEAEMAKALDTARNLTLFAPTDAAFAAADPNAMAAVRADKRKIANLVSHHITGVVPQPANGSPAALQTLRGTSLDVTADGAGLRVDQAKAPCASVEIAGGTIYLIDSVLFPPP
ncbi:Uncaracterized surface protein containing fasciclin (FAS1) repeats [Actinokineospora alba]|uniref:Uncaracterized surface protein containing fasciclin (FAS1) repeats n=1 Tax=Actinokineospora alba TaxID=504798 RepID=A0A1H0F4S7_9PSEU|nr:fasciclin domain-containing protein [Actinokineospora alba]TDP69340.1 putative surface protein with fasciclin (FAS1) repeats [Actinokineospora alba]SDI18893.1 Uncaracterized surface protein containing fasciclin (FAS1) repeats [Actinokineospora alba]SDN89654.1 Uncaracterized surface protein containing fasciclin (FAS1) repeats [Actinokineospora alba]